MVQTKENLSGKVFGCWMVIEQADDYIEKNGKHRAAWKCMYNEDSTQIRIIKQRDLKSGKYPKTNNMTIKRNKDLTGMKFGHLTVLYQGEDYICKTNHYKYKTWVCQCDCENKTIKTILQTNLLNGTSQSCGCLIKNNGKYKQIELIYDLTNNDYGICHLSDGCFFYFDIEDYNKIKDIYWTHTNKNKGNGYIIGKIKDKHILLSRYILNVSSDLFVDHINGNTLDNRKINLRLVTNSQNVRNAKLQKNNTSGHTGVSWKKELNKWMAYITYNNHRIHLGYFDCIQDAIKARKEAENTYFKEYSYMNSRVNNVKEIVMFSEV